MMHVIKLFLFEPVNFGLTLVVLTWRVLASIVLNLFLHYILKIFSQWRVAMLGHIT